MKRKAIPHDLESFKALLSDETLEEYKLFWGTENIIDLQRFNVSSDTNKEIIDYCNSRNIIVEGKNILEFGCRLGSSFLSWLSMDCRKIVGIDIDSKAINLSKKIYHDLGHENIEYLISSPNENLPVIEKEFDIVSCNAIIEHLPPNDRPKYINELSKATKVGGYFIVTETPNRLWLKERHTTSIWFLNYLPFKIKCLIGSRVKSWKGKIKYNDYDKWIEQGIVGVTYREIYDNLYQGRWENFQDVLHNREFTKAIIGNTKNPIKLVIKKIFILFAILFDKFYCKPNGFPRSAISPRLNVSFLRIR